MAAEVDIWGRQFNSGEPLIAFIKRLAHLQ